VDRQRRAVATVDLDELASSPGVLFAAVKFAVETAVVP
jgi:hypothetical protein